MRFGSTETKDRLKNALPVPIMRILRAASLASAYQFDLHRYLRFSSSVRSDETRANLAAWITMQYHNVEKGLSLPSPRPGFGAQAVSRLLSSMRVYEKKYGHDEVIRFAIAALHAYVLFNITEGLTESDIPEYQAIIELPTSPPGRMGGAMLVRKCDVAEAVSGVNLDFFLSRSSVRQFASRPVSAVDVEFAALAAQKSPAVCNRQFSRIYTTSTRASIDEALAIQGGARGFGDKVPCLAVITSSLRSYWNAEERMQPWTDGGMFAMSFVLALHSRGLGTVCLNWSKTQADEQTFRKAFDIGNDEVIVMLVAFGHLPEEYRVAASPRVALDHTLTELRPAHPHGQVEL